MFDITQSRQVFFQDGRAPATIFRDRTNETQWYMIPEPRLRTQDGAPAFSVVKYETNGDGLAGRCSFEVELVTPEEVKAEAQRQNPGIAYWGQFTWVGGEAFLNLDFLPDISPIAAQPSLFGNNVALFQFDLKTPEDLNNLIATVSQGEGVSTLNVEYQMLALTQLLGASATVSYDANVAFTFQQNSSSSKDAWGNITVRTEVSRQLQESKAGTVVVTPGAVSNDDLKAKVEEWAWSTLEKEVARIVEVSAAANQGTTSAAYTSNFTRTYAEDMVVEWGTPTSRFIHKFDADAWKKVFTTVDNRQLAVTFQLVGDYLVDGASPIAKVDVTVFYPTKTTGNTFTLIPADAGTEEQVSHQYVAPGESKFNPEFSYEFVVTYTTTGEGPVKHYTSERITSSSTIVNIYPSDYGLRNVTFQGAGIPFDKISKVYIDFFDIPPAGEKPRVQTVEMTNDTGPVVFSTTYFAKITNEYRYQCRYLRSDNTYVIVRPLPAFGSANADRVIVLDPANYSGNFFLLLNSTDAGGFKNVIVTATYEDQNEGGGNKPTHQWTGLTLLEPNQILLSDEWTFPACPDPDTAYFKISLTIMYGSGGNFRNSDLRFPYNATPLVLSDNTQPYSVSILTEAIDWGQVGSVQVTLFQLQGVDKRVDTDGPAPSATIRDGKLQKGGENEEPPRTINDRSLLIFPPEDGVKVVPQYYVIEKNRADATTVFFYKATYTMLTGEIFFGQDVEVTTDKSIQIPAMPSTTGPGGDPTRFQRLSFAAD